MRALLALVFFVWAGSVCAEPVRLALFNTGLSRAGPGLLFRDIRAGKDMQVAAVTDIILRHKPDILVLLDFDNDAGNLAIGAFSDRLGQEGLRYPFVFAPMQNAGQASGLDLDGDGRLGGPRDALGYGAFRGQGQMALLSRYPIDLSRVEDARTLMRTDLPDPTLPKRGDGSPFPDLATLSATPVFSKSFWTVPVTIGGTRLDLLISHHTTPVFDGPEDLNGTRNRDELGVVMNKAEALARAEQPFVILSDLNLDPADGEGARRLLAEFLKGPIVQDPKPSSEGGRQAADQNHSGDPSLDTTDWKDFPGPGNLRVDYVLPSRGLRVLDAGVFWPPMHDEAADLLSAAQSSHRLVWVDIDWP